MIVKDIMSHTVKTAKSDTLIKDIAWVMCLNKISGVPVVDDSHSLTGVLAEKGILREMFPDVKQLITKQMGSKPNFEAIEADYTGILDKKSGWFNDADGCFCNTRYAFIKSCIYDVREKYLQNPCNRW